MRIVSDGRGYGTKILHDDGTKIDFGQFGVTRIDFGPITADGLVSAVLHLEGVRLDIAVNDVHFVFPPAPADETA